MPRITKKSLAEAVAGLPFSPYLAPDDPRAFANLPESMQAAIVAEVHRVYYVEGRSAGYCRALFGGTSDENPAEFNRGLSGKVRRELFRAHGFPNAIARSYPVYRDGEPRKGSSHARMHGEAARERQAEEAKAQAQADAKAQAAAARKLLREAGIVPARSAAKLREQYAAYEAAIVAAQAGPDADADAS